MLAREARDAAPVPEGPAREETPVGLALPLVADDRRRDVPALPARLRGAIAEIDVLAVQREAGVEAAELVEHRAAEAEEAAEQPVGLHRLDGLLAEVVVGVLVRERRGKPAKRCPPHEGAAHRRKPAA